MQFCKYSFSNINSSQPKNPKRGICPSLLTYSVYIILGQAQGNCYKTFLFKGRQKVAGHEAQGYCAYWYIAFLKSSQANDGSFLVEHHFLEIIHQRFSALAFVHLVLPSIHLSIKSRTCLLLNFLSLLPAKMFRL